MCPRRVIRSVFVGDFHNWQDNEDMSRVFDTSNRRAISTPDTSQPQAPRPLDSEAEREDLRRQIAPAEAVIVVLGRHTAESDW